MKSYSQKFLRKRKMLLVMPLLTLPFLTLAFWALGGGKTAKEGPLATKDAQGLNPKLPDAKLKNDKGLTKMSYYEMAQTDSEKLKMRLRNDPFLTLKGNRFSDSGDSTSEVGGESTEADGMASMAFKGESEAGIYGKLKEIDKALEEAKKRPGQEHVVKEKEVVGDRVATAKMEDAYDRYQRREEKLPKPGVDSEMLQINAMLDKVMDIQHPERVNERLKQYPASQGKQAFSVYADDHRANGFYDASNWTDGAEEDSMKAAPNAVEAMVPETQTLVNGSFIRLRLLNDINVAGRLVPRGLFVTGKATLAGERLEITITHIRYLQNVLPVAVAVTDMDGMDGIYVPGAIGRDVAKQSTDNALQSVGLNSLDPSLGAQAIGAGIATAKTFISKKVRLVRVTVKAGYHVLLRDTNNQ